MLQYIQMALQNPMCNIKRTVLKTASTKLPHPVLMIKRLQCIMDIVMPSLKLPLQVVKYRQWVRTIVKLT